MSFSIECKLQNMEDSMFQQDNQLLLALILDSTYQLDKESKILLLIKNKF